jgi:hypothetical protein
VCARVGRGEVALVFDPPVLVLAPAEAARRLPEFFGVSKRSIQSSCSLSTWIAFSAQPLVSGS